MYNVFFLTLGCSKNEVDTSLMQNVLDSKKFLVSKNINDSEVIVINTCAFIDSAKEESIDTILEAATYKKTAKCKKIILAGCLAQRYPEDLLNEIPEIDGILGTGNLLELNDVINSALIGEKAISIDNINSEFLEGYKKKDVNTTEYIKISEGCNNNCSYCIIPKLRGRNRSRKIEDIYDEVNYLVKNGTREIILIAQNTTDYGIDNYGDYKLHSLISKLSEIEKLKWIRVMYLYPDNFTDELIEEFKTNEKLLKYVDIPLQHVSDHILKEMNRKTNKFEIESLLTKLRLKVPNIVIRTTLIIGFPGETESDFNELLDFIENFKFDKLGAFTYSREEGTSAYNMTSQIDEDIKLSRRDKLLDSQQYISSSLLMKNVNKTFEVLVEERESDNIYTGRTYMDSPEIDGVVYIETSENLNIGDFVKVKVKESLEYDLIGELL